MRRISRGGRIWKIFLNSDIEHRHFYLEGAPNRKESSDEMNQRYLRGAMKTGCRAILNCVEGGGHHARHQFGFGSRVPRPITIDISFG
jgi:hypothetical protein